MNDLGIVLMVTQESLTFPNKEAKWFTVFAFGTARVDKELSSTEQSDSTGLSILAQIQPTIIKI